MLKLFYFAIAALFTYLSYLFISELTTFDIALGVFCGLLSVLCGGALFTFKNDRK